MHRRRLFKPGRQVIGIIGPDVLPAALPPFGCGPRRFDTPAAGSYKYESGSAWIEAERVRRTCGIVTVSLALDRSIGTHFPAGNPLGNKGTPRSCLNQAIPPFELHPFPGPKVDALHTRPASKHEPPQELGQRGLGIPASGPEWQICGVNERSIDHLDEFSSTFHGHLGTSSFAVATMALMKDQSI
jgi:hypothetical protein